MKIKMYNAQITVLLAAFSNWRISLLAFESPFQSQNSLCLAGNLSNLVQIKEPSAENTFG